MLRRLPLFLRVVISGTEIDALDQINDTPRADETVHVYVRQPGAMQNAIHLNTGRKPGGGWFARAEYKLSPTQPSDEEVRSTKAWRQWCQVNQPKKNNV